ncbi:MAG TPA: prolyl oligopeptidase family serine peptidase [Bryobacteraceae bacterium]|nr:prolyl oligopeptidase family serine peptidase [Bryobacteraceae bacterium]
MTIAATAFLLCGTWLVAADKKMTYPTARRSPQVDTYHGVRVEDPYRWLEDADSAESKAWVAAENALTQRYLKDIPERERILKRLTELWNFERYSNFFKAGGLYFYSRNDGLQNQNVLYTLKSLDGKARVLLDPNTLSADGTVALSGLNVSDDGKLLAYSISRSGSDWLEWRIRDIETGRDLPDLLRWSKFSAAGWSMDSKGFYYQRFAEPRSDQELTGTNYYAKLYYHKVGEPQSADKLIYERPDQKDWQFSGGTTEDGRYLIIEISKGAEDKNLVYYQDLKTRGAKVRALVDAFEGAYSLLGSEGSRFYFRSTGGSPRGRIIMIDVTKPGREHWKEIVPEQQDTLQDARMAGGMLTLAYLKDAYSAARIYKLDGTFVRDVDLPGIGSVGWSAARSTDRELFYAYTSFTAPATLYRYDLQKGVSTAVRQSKLNFDPDAYETKQIFYASKDGTRVPMFLVYKKGLKQDRSNPTYLYGYGGFNISMTPSFSVSVLEWMERGGLLAVPNLRGGGEYGEAWHEAGTKKNKQNVFEDFIAAAEWLIANRYTSTPKLAIAGGSNGGLLVGACLNQRPDLFGAALPAVGVMDMLRFHKFTIGWAWTVDYGSPDNAEEFRTLMEYSPLHNIRMGTKYPATLVTTADHDDRVVSGHSFKYAAALQHAQEGPAPILIRIETKAGHGAGKPTSKLIEEAADRWAFLQKALNIGNP